MDFAILYGIQDLLSCPLLDALMPVVTACGDHGLIWIIAGILLLIFPKTRRWGITLLVTLAVTWAICEFGVKNLVARPRPFIVDSSYMLLIAAPASFSFPSGHTLSSFLAATVITRAPVARGWKIVAWVMAVAIAFSRLYLFVHFPTDVLAGAIIGTLAGLLGVYISNRIASNKCQRARHTDS